MVNKQQQAIIEHLQVKPTIDAEEEIRRRVGFMKAYLQHTGARGYALGISGGQDSTLAGKLAQLAVDEYNADPTSKNQATFLAVRLPYGVQKDEDDCQDALRFIGPTRTSVVNIKPAVDAAVEQFEAATGDKLGDFHKGNVKARERMKAQYDLAAHYGLLVLGTDHAAEAITGFYTKHGDGACDMAPIYGLNKRQGRALLEALNCPAHLYTKKPTADLEDLKPGIPDEVALGMTYEQLDDYLEGKTLPVELSDKIEARYKLTEHKRRGPVTVYDDWWKE
ncbi:ammonia-dependent NAD(+) synthetase [Paenibacillus sp. BC26]|uniref:ammonia-dependent NAD(+) synthetase n=1 Tax=Paenibacillus sp. BC26 TaxID=1881032 RepID=UPI0008EA952A|nr:ammonia-dependent NAD(+) synthetase [Paenibacillus sp. BC26]SFT18739.1 NH(3)-dependent NAD(+) synthetase [Paenibacillus sp. BC26]